MSSPQHFPLFDRSNDEGKEEIQVDATETVYWQIQFSSISLTPIT